MAKANDQLFSLIKSLSKSEKRSFKLYAKRTNNKDNVKFIRLFDLLDKMDSYDESEVRKKWTGLSPSQLSNLKRHLYKQLLTSLRLIHISKNIDIEIREQIDFARILYGKGLYLQSLKLLDRIKGIAMEHHQDLLLLEIIEFQKQIEERHITRSRRIEGKVPALLKEAENRSRIVQTNAELTNLKIKIHGLYIQIGHAKNDSDRLLLEDTYRETLSDLSQKKMTVFEKASLYQSYVWYYYILLDFDNCLEYARMWVQLFDDNPNLKIADPDLYMRGLHYVLTSLFYLDRQNDFDYYLEVFENFRQENEEQFTQLSHTISFLYFYTAKLNHYFLKGTYVDGLPLVPKIEQRLKRYQDYIDRHRVMVFYYKIAYLYLGAGHPDRSLDYLNRIVDLKIGHLREDIQSYARILLLLTHYELGNYTHLDYQIKAVHRFLDKMKGLSKVQLETLRFIRSLVNCPEGERAPLFRDFREVLLKLSTDRYEKRAFLYLDILSWVEQQMKQKKMRG